METSESLVKSPGRILDEVNKVIVGKRDVLELILFAILSNGHVLFEDLPGLAKTLTARSFASSLGCDFKRIQFTSDLLPADITGSYVFNRGTSQFELRRGPVFCNILLADEINRAPPRTQSALLEAMQERQVTIENETLRLDSPFIVLATQNPIEYEGTYPLPEAQLDRFLIKISIGYPTPEEETTILERRSARQSDEVDLNQIVSRQQVLEIQREVEKVHIERDLEKYIVQIVSKTREHAAVEIGSSPRGSLAVLKLSRARAWMNGRDFVIPDDVKSVIVPALNHRMILTAEHWLRGTKPQSVIDDIVSKTEVPKVRA
ncbi:MAG: AAA family ATPase [Nitrososphaerales archaeon]